MNDIPMMGPLVDASGIAETKWVVDRDGTIKRQAFDCYGNAMGYTTLPGKYGELEGMIESARVLMDIYTLDIAGLHLRYPLIKLSPDLRRRANEALRKAGY